MSVTPSHRAVLSGPQWVQATIVGVSPLSITATVNFQTRAGYIARFQPLSPSGEKATFTAINDVCLFKISCWLDANAFLRAFATWWLQLWFPANYSSLLSTFGGMSAYEYYIFLLNKLPNLAFTTSSTFDPTGVQVVLFQLLASCKPLHIIQIMLGHRSK